MGKRTNSNIRRTVTYAPFAMQLCQRCTFDPKKKNPYWISTYVSTFTNYSYEEMQSSTYSLSHSVLMIKIHKHFSWESPLGMTN